MKTLDLQEAAAFLKMSPEGLRRLAKARKVPAAKPGKAWVFLDTDLAEYIRSTYAQNWQTSQVSGSTEFGGESWHCENEAGSGGSISTHPMEREYAALLGRKIND